MWKRPKDNQAKVSELVTALLRQYGLEEKYYGFKARENFVARLGKLDSYVNQIEVRDRILHVRVISAPLRQELSIIKDKMVDEINEALGVKFLLEIRLL